MTSGADGRTGLAPDLLWHSAPPGAPSAYGQQAELVLGRMLRDGYVVDLSTTAGAGVDLPIRRTLHASGLEGFELARNVRRSFAGTGVPPKGLAFTNIEMLHGDMCAGVDLMLWIPFNCAPPPRKLMSYFRRRDPTFVLAFTQWAQSALHAHDIASRVVPCAIDTTVFRPDDDDARRARDDLGLPHDAFVVGVVAVNNEWFGNRKSLPEVLMAFTEFARRRSDVFLLLHTDTTGDELDGLHLDEVMSSLGTPAERVRSTSPDRLRDGLSRAEVASMMRAMDVLAAPSAGEGFGVPVIEAQACGVPVIVSNWATQAELVGSGWAVGGQPRWADWLRSWQFTPSVPDIVDALEEAYRSSPSPSQAVEFASRYEIDSVYASAWRPLLESWLGRR